MCRIIKERKMPQTALTKRIVQMDQQRIEIAAVIKEKIETEVAKSKATIIKVDCFQDTVDASAVKTVLKALCNQLNDKRLEFGRVITAFKKRWDVFFNDPAQPALDEIKRIEGMEQEYQAYLEEENRKAEEKRQAEIAKREALQKAHKEKGHKINEVPRAALVPEPLSVKSQTATKTRKFWTWDQENYELANIPREYLTIDKGKVTAAVRSGVRNIPGIRIYQDTSVL